jgi:hypothetical protein
MKHARRHIFLVRGGAERRLTHAGFGEEHRRDDEKDGASLAMADEGAGHSTRTLVVWCPDWPLSAVGIEAAVPGAVLDKQRIAACTAAARSAGVKRGQRQRDAQRLCPDLVLKDRDLDAEGRLFETVAAAVASLAPRVEVLRPGVCAIPARGAARFHGGEEALRMLLQDAVVETGHDCGVGIADGLFTAELAARSEGGVIVPAGEAAELLMNAGLPVESVVEAVGVKGATQVLDVEVTSNRTDCFCHVGLARELAALTGGVFAMPKIVVAESGVAAVASTTCEPDSNV